MSGFDIVEQWRKTAEPIWDDVSTAEGEWKRLSDLIDGALIANPTSRQTYAGVPSIVEILNIIFANDGGQLEAEGPVPMRIAKEIYSRLEREHSQTRAALQSILTAESAYWAALAESQESAQVIAAGEALRAACSAARTSLLQGAENHSLVARHSALCLKADMVRVRPKLTESADDYVCTCGLSSLIREVRGM